MSLYALNEFGYLQQVEAYFLSLSQIGVTLSSRDTQLIRHWRDTQVALWVVCTGIKQAFGQLQTQPRSIYACRRFIEKLQKEHIAAVAQCSNHNRYYQPLPGRDLPDPTQRRSNDEPHSDAPPPPVDPLFLEWGQCMSRLIALGKKSLLPPVQQGYRWAYRQMKNLQKEILDHDDGDHLNIDITLAIVEIEAELFEKVYNDLQPDQQLALDRMLTPEMCNALEKMAPVASRRQRAVWMRRMMQENLGLEPFYMP